jgi:hypothetical protein
MAFPIHLPTEIAVEYSNVSRICASGDSEPQGSNRRSNDYSKSCSHYFLNFQSSLSLSSHNHPYLPIRTTPHFNHPTLSISHDTSHLTPLPIVGHPSTSPTFPTPASLPSNSPTSSQPFPHFPSPSNPNFSSHSADILTLKN